jgi:hypothetical protein
MPEAGEFARHVVGTGAGFHHHRAGVKRGEKQPDQLRLEY